MKLKITVTLKNGRKVEVIKKLSDPPKGTDLDTHYMLEAVQMVECIQQNGLCLSIAPNQIGNIFIKPKKEAEDGTTRSPFKNRQAVQGVRMQPAPQS